MSEQDNQAYLQTKVNPILHQMCVALLTSKPEGVVDFMLNWLQTEGHNIESGIPTDQQEDDDVRTDSSDEDEEGDEVFELPSKADLIKKKEGKTMRQSVSAEAYGKFNKKEEWVPVVIEKTQEQKSRILEKLNKSFMFSLLEESEKDIVVDAMGEKHFKTDEHVIKQGEKGDHLYVVDEGQLECTRIMKTGEQPTFLKMYGPGEAFGELALLYNAPRAATLKCTTDCSLFVLDRETFNHVVKGSAVKKRNRYEAFLSNVELLDTIDPYERGKIADVIKAKKYKKGDYVIRQGEKGNTFYFIEEGEAVATKRKNGKEDVVYEYKANMYFGELALLKGTPRQASIIAATDLSVVYLERSAFMRLLGPLEDILKRNMKRYEQFALK